MNFVKSFIFSFDLNITTNDKITFYYLLQQKMKKILLASIGLLSLSALSFTYADEVKKPCTGTGCEIRKEAREQIRSTKSGHKQEIKSMTQQIKEKKEMMELEKKSFHADFLYARKHLAKPLTGEKRTLVNNIIKTREDAMKELQKNTNVLVRSWTVDRSGYITQATNIITTFRTNLLPYIAADQITWFDNFIQAKINLMISNVSLRQSNTSIKMEIWNKKVMFKEWLKEKKSEYKDLVKSIKKVELEDDDDDDKWEQHKNKNKIKSMKKMQLEDDDEDEDEEDDD